MDKKVFIGAAAFLNGTEIGQLLLDISQVPLDHEPEDPQVALIERVKKYADDQAAQSQHMTPVEREHNGHMLRTRAWLQDLSRAVDKPKHERVLKFLRGLFKFERKISCNAQEQPLRRAA